MKVIECKAVVSYKARVNNAYLNHSCAARLRSEDNNQTL